MFAGFGTAEDTNVRFKQLLADGGTGLSTAFDLPTLMGRDSDDDFALGEVGKAGVAVDTLADMEDLFADIDLGGVSTSMTINSPASILLAMYVAVAEQNGTPRAALNGTLQNDILKEYQAQKEYIFPPRPSVRLVSDLVRFTAAEMPKWNPISISGYHIREAGSTAAEELAFTLGNGFAYVEAALAAGLDVDEFAPRLSFFFNSHIDFFEEIGKLRAARRIWARWMKERYGAQVRAVAQAPVPHPDRRCLADRPAARDQHRPGRHCRRWRRRLGGTQSLHTDAYDEALALPTEKAARIALRTQQIVAHETGVGRRGRPARWSTLRRVDDRRDGASGRRDLRQGRRDGFGVHARGHLRRASRTGWFQGRIADSAYAFERKVNNGERIVVGVNAFTDGDDAEPPLLYIGPEVEERQLKRLATVKHDRNDALVTETLAAVTAAAADPTVNTMPPILDAVRAYATVGEIIGAMKTQFGVQPEDTSV